MARGRTSSTNPCGVELRLAVATWLHHYLHHRPHQALNWQAPTERRAERLAAHVALAA
jgi:transposase InsO family protein